MPRMNRVIGAGAAAARLMAAGRAEPGAGEEDDVGRGMWGEVVSGQSSVVSGRETARTQCAGRSAVNGPSLRLRSMTMQVLRHPGEIIREEALEPLGLP